MQELYKSTSKVLLKILLVSIISAFVLEGVMVLFMYLDGDFSMNKMWGVLARHCLFPSLAAAVVYVAMYMILDSPNVKREIKRHASFIGMALVCFCIIISYPEYTVLSGLLVVPIMFSAIYGEQKYIRLTAEVCIFLQLVVFVIRLLDVGGSMYTGVGEGVISILLLVFSMFFAGIIRNFAESNSSFFQKQLEHQTHLSEQISVDGMTGLYNHATFYDELSRLIKETDKTKQKLCIAVIDIDDFKMVNDNYGHPRGDEVLKFLSGVLKEMCQDEIVCRYGGEEFAVIFTDKSLKECCRMMEGVLEVFSGHRFEWCDNSITFSCGVCQHYDIRVNASELFKQADKYLYKAKRSGKNRVISE